jgi:hypothetical protein
VHSIESHAIVFVLVVIVSADAAEAKPTKPVNAAKAKVLRTNVIPPLNDSTLITVNERCG